MAIIVKKKKKKKRVAAVSKPAKRRYLVSLKNSVSIVVSASDQEDAVSEWKKLCRIQKSTHGFRVRAITKSYEAKLNLDVNGVVIGSIPKPPAEGTDLYDDDED